ncbi:Glycosyl transferase group 1 [uncultured Desulfatiglans sp.]|nr:Glycosyl transferase group 1 [uncultured Desulfatiglans sp.]
MKIVLLAGASSTHTIRWANGLDNAGLEVHIITQHSLIDNLADSVNLHLFPFRGILGYFTMVPAVKRLLDKLKPDLVNAHYASGYGTTARLVRFRPWLLSVWGSDVYDFPFKSPLHRWLVCENLLSADALASTSWCMAKHTFSLSRNLTEIFVTPFGVDFNSFLEPINNTCKCVSHKIITIGTVKAMAYEYGIDTLIHAFALATDKLNNFGQANGPFLRLRLVGNGPQMEEYKLLVRRLHLSRNVEFVGRVPHSEVPNELAKLDIFVALSRSESFGVAVIEAGAAGKPVIVSDAGGLREVVLDNQTGIVVPRDNPHAAAEAIIKLVKNETMRLDMGIAAKSHVREKYNWDSCVDRMINLYKQVIYKWKKF